MRRTDIIKVPVLESLFPVPRNFDDIKADIEKRGIQMPLTISTNNELVCGHTRYRIAQELGIDDIPVAEPVKFTGLNDMKRYAISDNDLRRQMTDLERYEYVVKPLLEMEREEAKEREKAGVKIEPYPQNAGRVGESVDVVGKQVGWSGDKVQRLKRISENCSIEAKAAFNDGELSQKDALLLAKESTELQNQITENIKSGETQSVTSAKRQVTKETTTVLPLPDGKFDVIYADPPWQYRNSIRQWGPARLHYSTLPLEDICALEIPSAENAVLFLWVTNPFVQDAFQVVEAWGFEYKTNAVWVKRNLKRPGSGFYLRGRHELLFICTKGSFVPNQKGKEPIGTVIDADVSEHSRKPGAVYELIERLYPLGKYLELFARNQRQGWASWGLEA